MFIFPTAEILDESPLLPEQYRREANALRQHYADKEICPERTVADKCALTAEWYSLSHQLLIDKTELSESDVRDSVEQAHLAQFRSVGKQCAISGVPYSVKLFPYDIIAGALSRARVGRLYGRFPVLRLT